MSLKSLFKIVKRTLPAVLAHAPAVILALKEVGKAMKTPKSAAEPRADKS